MTECGLCDLIQFQFDLMIRYIKSITLPLDTFVSFFCYDFLDPLSALLAMPQPLLLLVINILSVYDILRTLRAEDIATETTVMSPPHYRQEFLLACETMGHLAVLTPELFGLQ